jgi:hypothetical protein
MIVIVGRILKKRGGSVYIEPYGTYDDWYDSPNEDARKWVAIRLIESINDETFDPDTLPMHQLRGEPIEIGLPDEVAIKLLR